MERGASLRGQQRMAGDEDQAQQIIADLIVGGRLDTVAALLIHLELGTKDFVLGSQHALVAQPVDGAVAGGRREPRPRIVGDAGARPLLERRDERILRELLGCSHVAGQARESRDELRRLDPPDRIDGALDFRGLHGPG